MPEVVSDRRIYAVNNKSNMSGKPAAVASQMFHPTRLAALLGFATLAIAIQGTSVYATSLSGTWKGGGQFTMSSGAKEKVRCRVRYTKTVGTNYAMNARCASASGHVEQAVMLKRVGKDRYSGSAHNRKFGVTVYIGIRVSGKKQSVVVSGVQGRAHLALQKR